MSNNIKKVLFSVAVLPLFGLANCSDTMDSSIDSDDSEGYVLALSASDYFADRLGSDLSDSSLTAEQTAQLDAMKADYANSLVQLDEEYRQKVDAKCAEQDAKEKELQKLFFMISDRNDELLTIASFSANKHYEYLRAQHESAIANKEATIAEQEARIADLEAQIAALKGQQH